MNRSLHLLGTWLWFALIGWASFLILVGAPAAWALLEHREAAAPPAAVIIFGVVVSWLAVAAAGTHFSRRLDARGEALEPLERFAGWVRVLLLLTMLGLVARGVLHLLPEGEALGVTGFLDRVFEPAWYGIESLGDLVNVPSTVAGVAVAPVALFVLVVLSGNALRWRLDRLRHRERGIHASIPGVSRRAAEEEDERTLARARAAERKIALSSYAEARRVLKDTEMDLTFLALDIVGSTKMKEGEDPYVIEQSFGDYRKLVERALRNHGAYKQTWTPDGQMAAFRSPQAAVECGKEVLRELPRFSREVSRLRTDFRLRLGAHSGTVSTDDQTPMEAISDASIDVAGHLQKYADPGCLWVSEVLLEGLHDPEGFEPLEREVDGFRVFSWKPGEEH